MSLVQFNKLCEELVVFQAKDDIHKSEIPHKIKQQYKITRAHDPKQCDCLIQKAKQCEAKQCEAKQREATQSKAKQRKAKQSKATESNATQRKAMQRKAK